MSRLTPISLISALMLSIPAGALQANGPLRVLPMGEYECSYPGNAASKAWLTIDGSEFRISSASRYLSAKGNGTYLLAGDQLTFTRGPMKGMRFERTASTVLYQVDRNGKRLRFRCSLTSRN